MTASPGDADHAADTTTEQLEHQLQETLSAFAKEFDEPKTRSLLGDSIIADIGASFDALKQRLDDEFRIVLIGSFKRGKSTLINALLKEEIVPMDVVPETITINEIRWGQKSAQIMHLRNGGRLELAAEDLQRKHLKKRMERLDEPVSHLEVIRPYPDPALKGVVWVDTPGTEDAFEQFEAQIADYLAKADLVVILISATAPLSASELGFLRRAVAPQEFGKLYVVINRIDRVSGEAEVSRIHDHVHRIIGREFPGAQVVALSARDELARIKGDDRPPPEIAARYEAAFATFRKNLNDTIRFQNKALHLDRGLVAARHLISKVEQSLQLLKKGFGVDRVNVDAVAELPMSPLDECRSRLERDVGKRIAVCHQQAASWMRGFAERLSKELGGELDKLDPYIVDRHLGSFVEDQLQAALVASVQTQMDQLADIANDCQAGWQQEISTLIGDSEVIDARSNAGHGTSTLKAEDIARDVLQCLNSRDDRLFADLIERIFDRGVGKGDGKRLSDLVLNHLSSCGVIDELVDRSYRQITKRLTDRLATAHIEYQESALAAFQRVQDLNLNSTNSCTGELAQAEHLLLRCRKCAGSIEDLRKKVSVALSN